MAGGGLFSYHAGETGSNQCTVFVDGSGNHWDRQVTGSTLSVLQCGAKPDNVTDNTTAFQSGVNWLISAFGGGTLSCAYAVGSITTTGAAAGTLIRALVR